MPSIPQISDAIDILNTHLSGCYPSTTKPLLLTYNPSARIPQREGYNEALKARASELSQLLSLRGAVDKRIAYIHAQMNDIRTACAGASALPVEILEYIFTIIAPPGVPHRSRFVMRIAQVSKRWRTVALWHKAFWTEFDFGSPTAGEPELLGTFIKRARPSNLLTLVAHNPASLDVALRYSVVSSLKKLHVAFDASHLSNAIQHLSTNPLLTGLISLGLHIQDDDRLLTDGPFMAPSIISLTTPSLRHITFTKCRTWDVSIEQYCRIESLAFSQCDFWPPFIALFGYLRDLRLVRVETPRSGGDAGFELKCLGSLVIQSCSEAFIECFFRMITFPALRSCRLISPSTSHFPSELNYTEDIARALKRSTELNHLLLAGTSAYILCMLRHVYNMSDIWPPLGVEGDADDHEPCVFPLAKLTVLHYRNHETDEPRSIFMSIPNALSCAVSACLPTLYCLEITSDILGSNACWYQQVVPRVLLHPPLSESILRGWEESLRHPGDWWPQQYSALSEHPSPD